MWTEREEARAASRPYADCAVHSKTSANQKEEEIPLMVAEQSVVPGNWVITFILGQSCSSRLTVSKQLPVLLPLPDNPPRLQGTKLHSLNWELGRDWHAATLSSNKMATRLVLRCKRHFSRAWRYQPIPQAQSLLPYGARVVQTNWLPGTQHCEGRCVRFQ